MKNKPCDYLIFDISGILFQTFFVHTQEDDATIAGLAAHTALITLNKYFKTFKPRKKIIMCFDGKSWRKAYTASEQAITKKPYKGNRRQHMTPKEKEKYIRFLSHVNMFENMIRDHTSIIHLAEPTLEADDLIAGTVFTIQLKDPSSECIIVSADKDLIQLIHPNVRLINPMNGTDRTLEEWDNNPDLFLFEKQIRGDLSDNIQSAFPHVRKTRIRKAFKEDFECANMMMETWTDQNGNEFKVKDLFEENKLLMDLREQPDHIQQKIYKTVLKGFNNPGTFSWFHFMKFIGRFNLKKVSERIDTFIPMLSQ